ncbi:MAG: NADAR family protein [Gemmataceae bacterium]
MTIYFYSKTDDYYWLSNFSKHGFQLDGEYWPTVEHYFQAQKFPGSEQASKIRKARTPRDAKKFGRDRSEPLREDWEDVKDDVMRSAVLQKFKTHQELQEMLLATGNEELVENAPSDYYWGCGADGTGKNRLGEILMEIRAQFAQGSVD